MAEIQHSFTKGMNRDISKDKFPHEAYYYLLNGRVMNDDNATMSDIINLKGNTAANINDNGLVRSGTPGYSIIGYAIVQNDIILFYAQSNATGVDSLTTYSIIDRLEYQGSNLYSRVQLWNGQGLNFRIDKPIKAVTRYESQYAEKIYWVDGNNPIRQVNIAVSISSQVASQFDFQGEFTSMFAPSDFDYTSGALKQGSIAYAYRLVKKNGYKTVFSDVSELIPVGKNIQYSQTLRRMYGDDIYDPDSSYNSGKGLVFAIYMMNTDYYTYYDYIEVVSLWYSSDSAIPDISIIEKIEIQNGVSTYRIIDTGTISYGTLTLAEFTDQAYSFVAKDLVSKDNRLFTANISEEYFDIDEKATWTGKTTGSFWDSRAYRFDSNSVAELQNSLFNVQYTLVGPTPNYASVVETADVINTYNKVTYVPNDEINSVFGVQKYQVDGSTLGGSGLNISYAFTIESFYLTSATTTDPTLDGLSLNKSQLGINKSFQRGEIYRFGIVFFDDKGRQSFVKWIGDIRMPSSDLPSANITSYVDSNVIANNLYPIFTVNNIPTINGTALDYQIVYVKREESDKSIVAAGKIDPTVIYSNGSRPKWGPSDIDQYYDNAGVSVGDLNKRLVNFISPEINFRDKESIGAFGTDYFLHQDKSSLAASQGMSGQPASNITWNLLVNEPTSVVDRHMYVRKYLSCGGISIMQGRTEIVEMVKNIPVTSADFFIPIDVDTYSHYAYLSTTFTISSPHGTCLTMRLGGNLEATNGDTNYFYGYLRKNVFQSAYGGLDYNSRQNNIFIPASNKIAGTTATATCKYGDTFITIFEYGKYFYQDVPSGASYSFGEVNYIACESSINCLLNTNDTYSRKWFTYPQDVPVHINEEAYSDADTGLSFTGMYGYNSAYNKLEDSKKFICKPVLFNDISEFNTKVKYSDLKLDNEDVDSWLNFRANNYNQANSSYGPINKIIEFNDKIFYFQDNATGILSINPRVTQQSTDGVTIVLGTGEIIDKFYYLSTDIGCQDNSDVIKSFSALYWLDKNKRKIYTFDGQIESITDLKGMHSYLKNNVYESSSFIGTYDVANAEVLMTVRDTNPKTEFVADLIATNTWNLLGNTSVIEIPFVVGRVYKIESGYFTYVSKTATSYRFVFSHGTPLTDGNPYDLSAYITERDNFTLAYNEKMQAFSSFYSFIPDLYIYHTRDYFTSENSRDLWQHNIGEDYNTFYGDTYASTLKLITNFGSQIQAEYTNIKFFAEVWNELGELIPNETISNISLKDSEQTSDDIILYPMHLPNDANRNRYVLDTSSLRIGLDWYTGKVTAPEGLVVYNNQLYRNIAITNQAGPPVVGANWAIAELCNIRKTNNHWITQLPRCLFLDNNTDAHEYSNSNRFRSNWLEITLELKDMMPGISLSDRRLRLSDIKLIYSPLQF